MIKKYIPWLIGLLYLISPYDVLPDFVLGLGWLDDLAVFSVVLWWVSRLKRAYRACDKSSAYARKDQETPFGKKGSEEDPYSILGVQRGASKQEIKAAYKKLAAQ